jgi:hypothetical protein
MSGPQEDATDLLRRLVGIPLTTPTRHMPNKVLAVLPPVVVVATNHAPAGEEVPIQDVQDGLDLLREVGEVRIDPDPLGHRSSFIGTVLLQLPGAMYVGSPARIRLTDPETHRRQPVRMPQVVMQPSYGDAAARQHWRDTLDREIEFANPPYWDELSAEQRDALMELHPTGAARFWGATANQDRNMQRLATGDVVFFTGGNIVRAVGEIGVRFRNEEFANLLWSPHEDRGSYLNVYSLRSFQPVVIPYEEIWALPGFNAGDVFMGLRILSDERADIVLQAFGITTAAAAEQESALEKAFADRLARLLGVVVPAESVNTSQTRYQQPEQSKLVQRNESLLLQAYRKSLGDDAGTRLKVDTGWTDYYMERDEGAEILEAKGTADHDHVRQALAQLLDYRRFSPQPVARLSALFPEPPDRLSVELLHDYGIDCVYLDDRGEFVRVPTPQPLRI